MKIAIVCGEFHKNYVERMLLKARSIAKENKLKIVKEVWVPGSLEKPLAIQHILDTETVDGVVVLGVIEKGKTKHGLVMAQAVFSAIITLQLEHKKPIGVGILGPEIEPDQIETRLESYAKNAVLAVKSMINVLNS